MLSPQIPQDYFEKYSDSTAAREHFNENWPSTPTPPCVSFASQRWVSDIIALKKECISREIASWQKPPREDCSRVSGSEVLFLLGIGDNSPFFSAVQRVVGALAATSPILHEMASVGGLVAREVALMRYIPLSDLSEVPPIREHTDADPKCRRVASLIMCLNAPEGMEGGGTFFPEANMDVAHNTPGVTVSFFNFLRDGTTINPLAYHTTRPLRPFLPVSQCRAKEVLVVFYYNGLL